MDFPPAPLAEESSSRQSAARQFVNAKQSDITATSVERYKALRLKDKVAPATVNRELATLKRMFRLGLVEPDHLLQLGFEGII